MLRSPLDPYMIVLTGISRLVFKAMSIKSANPSLPTSIAFQRAVAEVEKDRGVSWSEYRVGQLQARHFNWVSERPGRY